MFTYQTVEEFDGPSLWVRIWSYFFSSAGSLETILALFIIYAWSHMGPTAPAQHTIRTQRRRRRASSLSDAVRPPQSVIEETESEVDEANEEFVDALECFSVPSSPVKPSIPSIDRPAAPTTRRNMVTIEIPPLEPDYMGPPPRNPLKTFTRHVSNGISLIAINPFASPPRYHAVPAYITPSLTPQPRNHPNFYINNPEYLESCRISGGPTEPIIVQAIKQLEAAVEARVVGLTQDAVRQGKGLPRIISTKSKSYSQNVVRISRKMSLS